MANLDKSLEIADKLIASIDKEEFARILKEVKGMNIGGPTYEEYMKEVNEALYAKKVEVTSALFIGDLVIKLENIDSIEYKDVGYFWIRLNDQTTIEYPFLDKEKAKWILYDIEHGYTYKPKYDKDGPYDEME